MGGLEVEEGAISRQLWRKLKKEWFLIKYSPFFVCLASGKLEFYTTLRPCISQAVHFLRAFSKAYELAEDCADDDDDKTLIRKLRKRVIDKLHIHQALLQEWSFQFPGEGGEEESTPINQTLKYTDFLLATASGKVGNNIATPFEKTKVAAYTLGAMVPCMRIYASMATEFQGLLESDAIVVSTTGSDHICKKWVATYRCQDFEAVALQMEELLDRLSVSLTSEELQVLEKLYRQAMKLELGFFYAQSVVQQTIVPLSRLTPRCCGHNNALTIFCDFDWTCTAFDSSAILAEIAIVTAQKSADPQLARMPAANLRNSWTLLSTQYTQEYEQCIDSVLLSNEEGKELNYAGLCKALEKVAEFERNANSRVVQSGVLKGLSLDDIKQAGHYLTLQEGCRGFFRELLETENVKSVVQILSCCWCGDLIRSAFTSGDLNVVEVHSNELSYDEEWVSTGEIIQKMESAIKKLEVFSEIVRERRSSEDDEQQLTVYVGGSVGDLLCLLQADIGIVMGSSSSLRQLGEHFGVSFAPLFSGLVKQQREVAEAAAGSWNWNKLCGTLYTVSSWAEIQAFVLGVS